MPESKQTVRVMIKRPRLAGALAIAAAAIVAAPGPVLADSFLRLGDIKGESTDRLHQGEINILSFTQSFSNTASVVVGGGAGAGKASCGAITVMKNIDKSSPRLLKAVFSGEHIKDGKLTFRAEDRTRAEYYTITLTEVIVSELTQTDNPDPSRIVEKLVLNAAKFLFQYTPQDAKGTPGAPVKFEVNCAENTTN